MAKKKEEDSTLKKVKEIKEISNDGTLNIDISDIKSDLTDYMMDKIDKEVSLAIDRSNKKLVRYKNSIIFRKNIIIVILLIMCVFLGYNLYKISDISVNISTNNGVSKNTNSNVKKVNDKKEDKDDLEEKVKKYDYLIDDIFINDESPYIDDFYKGNLSDDVKLYLTLNRIDNNKITSEDGSVYIDEEDMKDSYESFLGGEFSPKSFEYNDLKFHYLSSKSLFIGDGEVKKQKGNIVKEIIDVNDDELLKITTIEGIAKDNKLYNVLNKKQVGDYKDNKDLKKYENDLIKVIYYFDKNEDNYILNNIEIKK